MKSLKVSLRKVRINRGGYTDSGHYYGTGAQLWWAGDDEGVIDEHFRAASRATAKFYLRNKFNTKLRFRR